MALLSDCLIDSFSLGVLRPPSCILATAGDERRVRPLPCPWEAGRHQPQVPEGCSGDVQQGQWVPEQGPKLHWWEIRSQRHPRRGRNLPAEENIPGRQNCKEGEFLVYLETIQLFTATIIVNI